MRHSTTRSLFERKDVIIVASVSCIYGIGPVENYSKMIIDISKNDDAIEQNLLKLLFLFNIREMTIILTEEIFGYWEMLLKFSFSLRDKAWRIDLFGDEIDSITEFDPLTGHKLQNTNR